VADLLRKGAETVQWQAFRTVCVKVAVMVGVSIAAGMVGGVVARAVGSGLLRAGAAPTLAKVAGGASGFAVDTAATSAGQSAIFGDSFGEAFLENALAGVGSLAMLKLLASSAEAARALGESAGSMWKKLGRAGLVLREGAAITGHTIMGAAFGFASRKIVTGKAQPAPETVREWLLQGAAVAVGRHVGSAIPSRRARLEHLGRLDDAAVRPLLEAEADLARRATALEHEPSAPGALDLLDRRSKLLRQELELLDILTKDPARLRSTGLGREAGKLRRMVEGELDDIRDPELAQVAFHLTGLEELIPGSLWKGTPAEIRAALDGARNAGADIHATRDPTTGRWSVKLADRAIEIHERAGEGAPPSPPHRASTSPTHGPRAADEAGESTPAARQPRGSEHEDEADRILADASPENRKILDSVLALDPAEGRRLIREYGDELTDYLRTNPLTTLEALKKTLGKLRNEVKQRVQGLMEAIDIATPPTGWRFDDGKGPETDRSGKRVLRTKVYGPNGAEGYFERAYDPHDKVLELRMAFLKMNGRDKALPNKIGKQGDAPEMIPGEGTPTLQYITLYQMRKLGVPMVSAAPQAGEPGVKWIHMSDIQYVETVVHLHWLRENVGGDLSDLVQYTASVKYAETTAIQSGYRRSDVPILTGGADTSIRGLLDFQERGNPQRIAENDAILAKYGFDRDTVMKWGFDVDFKVSVQP
jgi:hypothetical protein